MKRTMLIGFIAASIVAVKAHAQTTDQALQPVKKGNEWQLPKEVILRAQAYSQQLKKSLGLDSATTKKVFEQYMGNTKSVGEIQVGSKTEKEKKDRLAANQMQFDDKMKEVLTPKQFELYTRERKAGKLTL